MISYKMYKLLNEHFGPMALGVKGVPSIGVAGSVLPQDDEMGDDAGGDELEGMGGEEGLEDSALDSIDLGGDNSGGAVHHHHHYHITMPHTNAKGGDEGGDAAGGLSGLGFSPFSPEQEDDMASLAGIEGGEGEDDDMGDPGLDGEDDFGDDEVGGFGADGDDIDGDLSGLEDEGGDEEGDDFGGDEDGEDDFGGDDEEAPKKSVFGVHSGSGFGVRGGSDSDDDSDSDDEGDDDDSEESPPKKKSAPPKKDKESKKEEARRHSKKNMNESNETDDFMRALINNARGSVHAKKKIRYAEEAIIPPTDANAPIAKKPGSVGSAPQARLGDEGDSVKNDFFGYSSIPSFSDYMEARQPKRKK